MYSILCWMLSILSLFHATYTSFKVLRTRAGHSPCGAVDGNVLQDEQKSDTLGSKLGQDRRTLLEYWAVMAVFTLYEYYFEVLLSWTPFYFSAKLALQLWVAVPQLKGASVVFDHLLVPAFNVLGNHWEHTVQPLAQKKLAQMEFAFQQLVVATTKTFAAKDEIQQMHTSASKMEKVTEKPEANDITVQNNSAIGSSIAFATTAGQLLAGTAHNVFNTSVTGISWFAHTMSQSNLITRASVGLEGTGAVNGMEDFDTLLEQRYGVGTQDVAACDPLADAKRKTKGSITTASVFQPSGDILEQKVRDVNKDTPLPQPRKAPTPPPRPVSTRSINLQQSVQSKPDSQQSAYHDKSETKSDCCIAKSRTDNVAPFHQDASSRDDAPVDEVTTSEDGSLVDEGTTSEDDATDCENTSSDDDLSLIEVNLISKDCASRVQDTAINVETPKAERNHHDTLQLDSSEISKLPVELNCSEVNSVNLIAEAKDNKETPTKQQDRDNLPSPPVSDSSMLDDSSPIDRKPRVNSLDSCDFDALVDDLDIELDAFATVHDEPSSPAHRKELREAAAVAAARATASSKQSVSSPLNTTSAGPLPSPIHVPFPTGFIATPKLESPSLFHTLFRGIFSDTPLPTPATQCDRSDADVEEASKSEKAEKYSERSLPSPIVIDLDALGTDIEDFDSEDDSDASMTETCETSNIEGDREYALNQVTQGTSDMQKLSEVNHGVGDRQKLSQVVHDESLNDQETIQSTVAARELTSSVNAKEAGNDDSDLSLKQRKQSVTYQHRSFTRPANSNKVLETRRQIVRGEETIEGYAVKQLSFTTETEASSTSQGSEVPSHPYHTRSRGNVRRSETRTTSARNKISKRPEWR